MKTVLTSLIKVYMCASDQCFKEIGSYGGKKFACLSVGKYCGSGGFGSEYQSSLINGKNDYSVVKDVLNKTTNQVETIFVKD